MKKFNFGYRKVGKVLVACAVAVATFGVMLATSTVHAEEIGTSNSIAVEVPATVIENQSSKLEVLNNVETFNSNSKDTSLLSETEEEIATVSTEISSLQAEIDDLKLQQSVLENEKQTIEEEMPSFSMISHRGYNEVAPENNMVAFERAVEDGFTELETDLYFTKDNVPVLNHDDFINIVARNNDGSELDKIVSISNSTFEELQEYDFGISKGQDFKGTKISTFEQLLQYASEEERIDKLHVELKMPFTYEQKEKLVSMVNHYGLSDKVGWQSFHWEEFKDMDYLVPTMQFELLAMEYSDAMLSAAKSFDNGQRNVVLSLAVRRESLRKALTTGYDVYTWTVNHDWHMNAIKEFAFDLKGIMTNSSFALEDVLKGEFKHNLLEKEHQIQLIKSKITDKLAILTNKEVELTSLKIKNSSISLISKDTENEKEIANNDLFVQSTDSQSADSQSADSHSQSELVSKISNARDEIKTTSLSTLPKNEKEIANNDLFVQSTDSQSADSHSQSELVSKISNARDEIKTTSLSTLPKTGELDSVGSFLGKVIGLSFLFIYLIGFKNNNKRKLVKK
ncbi:glycerophosphodiester phosphodiesterase [Streptococcus suis]